MTVSVSSTDLLAALRFCKAALPKPTELRTMLQGIWLSVPGEHELRLEASDGACMARCTLDVPGLQPCAVTSVRRDNLAAVAARLTHGDATVTLAELQARSQIDGPRPDFARLFRTDRPKGVPTIGFDVKLLERAAKAALIVCPPKCHGVQLSTWEGDAAAQMTVPTRGNKYKSMTQEAYFLIMPMRL